MDQVASMPIAVCRCDIRAALLRATDSLPPKPPEATPVEGAAAPDRAAKGKKPSRELPRPVTKGREPMGGRKTPEWRGWGMAAQWDGAAGRRARKSQTGPWGKTPTFTSQNN